MVQWSESPTFTLITQIQIRWLLHLNSYHYLGLQWWSCGQNPRDNTLALLDHLIMDLFILQNAKKIKREGSISGFTCDNCPKGSCCWSTVGPCPCEPDVIDTDSQYCAGCEKAETTSAVVNQFHNAKSCRQVKRHKKLNYFCCAPK